MARKIGPPVMSARSSSLSRNATTGGPERSTLPASPAMLVLARPSRMTRQGKVGKLGALGSDGATSSSPSCSRRSRATLLHRRLPEANATPECPSHACWQAGQTNGWQATYRAHPGLSRCRGRTEAPTASLPQARRCKGTLLPFPARQDASQLANHRSTRARAVRRREGARRRTVGLPAPPGYCAADRPRVGPDSTNDAPPTLTPGLQTRVKTTPRSHRPGFEVRQVGRERAQRIPSWPRPFSIAGDVYCRKRPTLGWSHDRSSSGRTGRRAGRPRRRPPRSGP
jgi:hypothetical protein